MRALAELIVGADPFGGPHRIERMVSAAPVAWRPTPEAVYMVGTAASPVAVDDVRVGLAVGGGASLCIRSTAATVAWRGRGSRHEVTADVGPGADLTWVPEPTVATGGCDHHQTSAVHLSAGARLVWAEQLVLGRHGETAGSLRSSLTIDVEDRPLLRHDLRVGGGSPGWDGPAVLGAAAAVGLLVVAGPGTPEVRATGDGWAVMPLDGPGTFGVAVGSSALRLARAMDAMLAITTTG